jgi:hypothetical protein
LASGINLLFLKNDAMARLLFYDDKELPTWHINRAEELLYIKRSVEI